MNSQKWNYWVNGRSASKNLGISHYISPYESFPEILPTDIPAAPRVVTCSHCSFDRQSVVSVLQFAFLKISLGTFLILILLAAICCMFTTCQAWA